jgi:dUTP pyrophosphatase
MNVRITRIHPDAVIPEYKTPGACAFDLVCVEDAVVPPKQIMLLPTGIVVCTPPGYMLMVVPRSSTPIKRGLAILQGVGILDQDYCGPNDELKLQVYNFTDAPVEVKKGDRIYQAAFVRIDRAEWEEGATVTDKTRGGFGSTGT